MTALNLTFHHLGLAVKTPQAAETFLGALGYRMGKAVYDPLQGVNLRICAHDTMPDVELIWPEGEQPSPITNMLKKRDGLIYHMCYGADDAAGALAAMEKLGLRAIPLGEPKPAVLFDGLLVSFYHVDRLGIIEIIHNS